jgi:hypothetical protein
MIGPATRRALHDAKPKKLSNTARALLAVAATRDDHLILPPELPIAAVRQVARSLLGLELAEEVPACGFR